MLRLKLFFLVDLRGNACYHVAIVPHEWLSAYLNILICVVFLSLEATSHKLYILYIPQSLFFFFLFIVDIVEERTTNSHS